MSFQFKIDFCLTKCPIVHYQTHTVSIFLNAIFTCYPTVSENLSFLLTLCKLKGFFVGFAMVTFESKDSKD